MDLLKSDKECAEFGREFLERFLEQGYGTYSKSDLQDMLLYVANKASSTRFLDSMSNYDLSRVLKIPEQKINATRLNIALKFYGPDEGKLILRRFFERILDGRVLLQAEDKDFQFVVESNVDRREIENQLKLLGVTLNYKNNRQIAVVEKEFFLKLLLTVSERTADDLYKAIYKRTKKEEFKTKTGDVFKKIGEFAVDFTKDVLKDVIKDMIMPMKVPTSK